MGYTGDLQNNGGSSWSKYRNITVTAPAQALPNGYTVKFVATGADAAAIYGTGQQNPVRLEHNITAPANTTLNGAINISQATITLTSATGYPLTGMIVVDNERIGYNGITGNILQNCVRGSSGSTAAAHNSGVAVAYVKEMERHIETFTSSNVRIWWKLRATINAAGNDTTYRLHYGNSLAGLPPATIDNVFSKDYMEAGLVGLWHLDEGTLLPQDSSGNNNHATERDAVWSAGDGGQWDGQVGVQFSTGAKLDFTPTQQVRIADSASLQCQNVTLMAWVKADNLVGERSVISKMYGSGYPSYEMGFNTGQFNAIIKDPDIQAFSGLTITTGGWHFVVATYDGAILRTYVDGVAGNTSTGATTILYNTDPLLLGRWRDIYYHWDGQIDEVRVYNRALSVDEINTYYKRRMWVAADTVAIDGNFGVAGEEQEYYVAPPERIIAVKFIAS